MISDIFRKKEGGFVKSRLPQRVISDSDEEFLKLLERVKQLPDSVFWRECFNRSRITREYSDEKVLRLGEMASECGERYADEYRDELDEGSVPALCNKHGVTIEELAIPQSPMLELFGLFEAPNKISVRADLLQKCDDYVKKAGIDAIIGPVSCSDVLLAHEFFHYVEWENRDSIITCTYTEPQGLLKTERIIPALGEISAMSFARRLLSLDWNPFMLDCVMMSMDNIPAAETIARRLLSLDTVI
ncbi:MAG: hypothetical protein MSS54_01770 [Clostridiales bacterium]|nr:hypothetical protein [Clostridiales bacterium]